MSTIGKKIRAAIDNAGTTQKEVASKAQITESKLSRLLRKDIDDIDSLYAVCDVLNISPAKILSRPGDSLQMLNDAEKELLALYNSYPQDKQAAILDFLRGMRS